MDRDLLIEEASDAALRLNGQFNILLDAYDFYITRYPLDSESQQFELKDLQVSIKELGTLPHAIANQLQCWKNRRVPQISPEGFNLYILNEFALHMHSLARFMRLKHIDTEPFDPVLFGKLVGVLRNANRLLGQPVNTK